MIYTIRIQYYIPLLTVLHRDSTWRSQQDDFKQYKVKHLRTGEQKFFKLRIRKKGENKTTPKDYSTDYREENYPRSQILVEEIYPIRQNDTGYRHKHHDYRQ